jgi:hypothetical protein
MRRDFRPGEKHWHGATGNLGSPERERKRLEEVSNAQYSK